MSSIPWPLVEIAIEPKSKADQEKLGVALKALAADDPIIRLSIGEENGLTILGGADDLQLGDKISVLQGVYNLEAIRSAKPPATTINIPENKAVKLIATLIVLNETPKSD